MPKDIPFTPETYPLETRSVSLSRGGAPVLEDVSLQIAPGQLTMLLGSNGSGKSTLLAALSRQLAPARGQILLDGAEIARQPTKAVARRLGLLPQAPTAPEGLSVADLVARGRYPHQGLFRQWSRTDEAATQRALALTGLADLADRRVDSLSGGQRQRAWIAMVLAQEAGLILLDEPTTWLDLHHQVELLQLLRRLVREHGRTVVCVLHDLNHGVQYGDHLLFLKDGMLRHRLESPRDCTGAIVEEIFGTPVTTLHHPETGTPVFLPSAR